MDDIGEPVLLSTVRVNRGEVTCADVVDGCLIAGSGDGTLRSWKWQRGIGWVEDQVKRRAHRYGVTGARFSEWGNLLASIGVDGCARIWSRALVERRELAAPDAAAARALQWAAEWLVVGHDDGSVRVWDVRAAVLLRYLRPHEGAVHALATLAGHALLLTACTESVLKIYDFQDVVRTSDASGPAPLMWEDGVHDLGVACAASGRGAAATGGRDGRVRVWLVLGAGRSRRVISDALLCGHADAVTALHWTQHLLASASQDRTARVWEPASATCLRVLHAHPRYLTAVVISSDLRYMITGSNDKSVRTWSLGSFCVDDGMQPECNPASHYGLGDLEGIGPVDDTVLLEGEEIEDNVGTVNTKAFCVWKESYNSAVNCIAASGDRVATASSDGWIRIFHLLDGECDERMQLEREVQAHSYPAQAVDFGAGGALLLSAGLDASARLWDVQSGCELATLLVETVGATEEAGGGGVRGARLSSQRPPRLLLASDNGAAAVWGIDPPTPDPLHVFGGMTEAATCCSWSPDGKLLAFGVATGELRICCSPPESSVLCSEPNAHDLGVLSCDFAQDVEEEQSGYLLATGGRDAFVKLWKVEEGILQLLLSLAAHGGAVQCVRWGSDKSSHLLATGGADRWARVWRIGVRGGILASPLAAVDTGAAGGAPAVLLLPRGLLIVGSLSGELALWRLPLSTTLDDETDTVEPRFWSAPGVARWLYNYVTRYPGSTISEEEEALLLERVRELEMTGSRLLDDPLEDLLNAFGFGEDSDSALAQRLRAEMLWLRRDPLLHEVASSAPHWLRCPLTHRVLREPVRAADGFTYERAALADRLLAVGEEVRSPMSGRRLGNALVEPNYGVREHLRLLHDQVR